MSEARRHDRFIQLNRTFRTLRTDESGNDDVALNRAFQFGSCLTWVDLIKDFRVVVLSEAGTGKTREIRHVSQMLRQDGKPAFFLRLEHIPDQFEEAFEEGSFAEFQSWLASSDEGWLLLDSVDEARLRNPGDFELAVRKIGNRIGGDAQQRAHIVITGRITAWRPRTDLALCERHLPYSPATKSAATAANQPEERGPDAVFPTEDYPTNGRPSPFKIVAFDDLNATQIEIFAKAKGVKDPKRFLDAVERADARAFAARPQDLEELAHFWIEKGRIGSRLEIIEDSIDRRLDERDQGRADARPLSRARARNGARQIAAAVTLTRDSTIRIPDGADNQQGIPAGDILPDWDDKELAVLLSRPLFDEAIYGAVRFHHRSVQEFLTAEWLANLLERATSRRNIESLLFRNQYDLEVVVPAMRATLPWLALRDEHVRERICQVAPGILLEGGDPSRLPLAIRHGNRI